MSDAGEILKKAATSVMAAHPGVETSSGVPAPVGSISATGASFEACLLQVCSVPAHGTACDQVFTGVGINHELLRLRTTHGAGVGVNSDKLQAAPLEDGAISRIVQVVALVQPFLVQVEAVAVFHDELAHTHEAGLWPWFIAKLGLDLVPDLRQLLVAAQFAARNGGHDLFVRHAEAQIGALAIFQAKHVFAHACPAAAFFPGFFGQQGRQVELLPDLVHLFAHDGDHFIQRSMPQEEIAVKAGAELPDIPGPQQ